MTRFKSKFGATVAGYDRNDVVGLLVAQLAERYSHSITKKKSRTVWRVLGADLSLISDR